MAWRHQKTVVSMLLLAIAPSVAHGACLTTLTANPPFVPPAPYPTDASGGFWYGTDALWVRLPLHGDWTSAQHGEKLFIWSKGFSPRTAQQPYLIVTGKRLDGDAPAVAVAGGTTAFVNAPAMLIGVSFPTAGCWELNAFHDGHVLTFVVSVGP
jgi:hypothetical protein